MASELRVDTLKDSSGNNSVGMSYVAEGSAKAWVNFNGSSSASNPNSIRVSFNCSTYTDNGTGDYTITLTNSMNATNGYSATNGSGSNRYGSYQTDGDLATGSITMRTQYGDAAYSDAAHNNITIHGDLA